MRKLIDSLTARWQTTKVIYIFSKIWGVVNRGVNCKVAGEDRWRNTESLRFIHNKYRVLADKEKLFFVVDSVSISIMT